MNVGLLVLCAALLAPGMAHAIEISIDDHAARAVLKAVQDPTLTRDQALVIARLPGNEGLIEKIKSYGRTADEDMLADALLAAAQRRTSDVDRDFQFAKIRDAAPQIESTLDQLENPSAHAMDDVKRRVAQFSPESLHGTAKGYLITGGTSGGFSFGKPEFFLNLARFPSPLIAQTILEHELYHGVQGLARPSERAGDVKACLATLPGGEPLADLFTSLYDEGTASYVGDVLSIPKGDDATTEEQRKHLQTNIDRVRRSVTLLELSVHAITTSKIDYDDIYALGFYDDEILYALGYLMTKAIAAERGPEAVAALLGQPPSRFITTYAALPGYGKTAEAPALDAETLLWAEKSQACGA